MFDMIEYFCVLICRDYSKTPFKIVIYN